VASCYDIVMGERRELLHGFSEPGGVGAIDPAAERGLCTRFAQRIRLYGLRHLRDEAAAADLVQEVLLVLLASVRDGRINEPAHLERFVLGTCRNLVAKVRRGEQRTRTFEQAALPLAEQELPPAFARADTTRVAICLAHLDARAQRVVMLTFGDDRATEEIASELGTTPGNVRVIRHRALAALQRCVEGGEP